MKKRLLSIILISSMIFSSTSTIYASSNISDTENYSSIIYDDLGNKIESIIEKSDKNHQVDIYINDVLDHIVLTNLDNGEMILKKFDTTGYLDTTSETIEIFNLNDFMTDAEQITDSGISIAPASAITSSTSYNQSYSFNTDYVYKGKILKAETSSCSYEKSTSDRYAGKKLTFSAGTAVGLVVSALIAGFSGPISAATVAALGIPVAAGVLVDSINTTVYYTKFIVGTRVYFDNIYTANVSQTYDKVLVTKNPIDNKTYYADDCYGGSMVRSAASYAASSGAKAFNDKYITGHKPNLSLPITSLPYSS